MQGIRYIIADGEGKVVIKKCDNDLHSSQRHFHEEVSFALVTSGMSTVEIQEQYFEVTEQTLVLIPQYAVHRCCPHDYARWRFRMLYCDAVWLAGLFGGEQRPLGVRLVRPGARACAAVERLFADLERGPFDMELESRLVRSLSLLLPPVDDGTGGGREEQECLEAARRYMDEHFSQDISLEDLASAAGISKYHLVRRFKRRYGLPPHQYLTTLRVNHAKILLAGPGTMADIALRSGFYDQSHFSKCFKAYTGITPGQYLRG